MPGQLDAAAYLVGERGAKPVGASEVLDADALGVEGLGLVAQGLGQQLEDGLDLAPGARPVLG